MMLNMLPEDVANDVRDKRHMLSTTQLVLDYVWAELARYNDRHLSAIHEKRDQDMLTHGPKNPVNNLMEAKLASGEKIPNFRLSYSKVVWRDIQILIQ